MKKIIFSLGLLFMVGAAQAQLEKGNWVMGGNLSFASNKIGEVKTEAFTLNPSFGIMFGSGFAGGINFNITSLKSGDEDAVNASLIGPFLRLYVFPSTSAVNFFINTSYGFGSTNSFGNKQGQRGYSLAAGPAIFLSRHAALEIALDYTSIKAKNIDDRSNTIGVKAGFSVYFGNKK